MQASAEAMASEGRSQANPAEVIAAELARWLGPNTARTAIRTFARQGLGVTAEQLRSGDVPKLLDALRPMLNTLLGAGTSRSLLDSLARRFAP